MTIPKPLSLSILATLLFTQSSRAQVSVKMHTLTGYEDYESFAYAACEKLQVVLNSTRFKNAVRQGSFTRTNGLTSQKIWEKIMNAHEVQGPGGKDSVVDLHARIITIEQDGTRWINNCKPGSWAGTIGIDGRGDGVTAICREKLKKFYDTKDTASLAGHYMHEYMHMLGFSHPGFRKSRSAVYKIGYIARDIIRQGI
ncbi:hypothetical protein [Chitinophaga tropicalis]|uniref:Peptidase M10 metallopeptidase domain-containing protein n=1 Tax=Chitinophaga tropicalis TaxID=2683588 RepID=A0A7K1U1X9_9BACT|nr:hypothetical protein [Chitinophaga tropicalis]MVT08343.1 hypothetical protein [Chitinophaga tropicalis]